MSTTTALKPKIYHLVDNGKTSVEHYQRVSANQRVRLENRKNDRPYLQITFTDKDGLNKTIRFKLNCNSPFQDEQIEKFKIPANEKFTDAEMNMPRFNNGVLVVSNVALQKFLDIHPQNEAFEGQCPDIQGKLFREYNEGNVKQNDVLAFVNRAKLATKIASLSLEDAQSMLIRLNGSFYKAPEELDDCILALVDIMDSSTDEEVIDLLRDGISLEDEITILISKATQADLISFEEPGMENFVVKKKGSQTIPLKEISKNLPSDDRRRLFSEFLGSNDGTLHLEDLRKMVDSLKPADDGAKKEGGAKEKPLDKMNKPELAAAYVAKFNEEPDATWTVKVLLEKLTVTE